MKLAGHRVRLEQADQLMLLGVERGGELVNEIEAGTSDSSCRKSNLVVLYSEVANGRVVIRSTGVEMEVNSKVEKTRFPVFGAKEAAFDTKNGSGILESISLGR